MKNCVAKLTLARYAKIASVLLALLAASPVYSVRMFVNIGRSLTLPCRGAPSRDVKWWFQQYEFPDWLDVAELYTGSFSSGNGFKGRVESFHLKDPGNYSLLLSPVVYSDLGMYKCQYIDETEIVLSDVKLEIGALLPASPVYSVRMFVNFGRSLTLPCHGAPSRDVEWYFQQYEYPVWMLVAKLNTGSFSSGNGFQGRVESFYLKDPGNYSLLLSPVVYSDLGFYKCQYYDDEIILSDVKLDIRVPSNVSVAVGMSASLPCFGKINTRARADDLDILWKRGGENVYQLLKNTITYGPGFENRASVSPEQALSGNMSLTIRQTRFSDEGDYQCFYNSPKERGNPDSASLFVTGHPPQNLTVKAGSLLSIPLYTADPVRVTFSAGLGSDEVLMLEVNKGPVRYGEPYAQRCELLAQNYTLLLMSVTLEDAGVYKVTDPETKKTIGSVSVQVSGRSAGARAGIVVGVLVALLVLAGSAFAVWRFRMRANLPQADVMGPEQISLHSVS